MGLAMHADVVRDQRLIGSWPGHMIATRKTEFQHDPQCLDPVAPSPESQSSAKGYPLWD